MTNMKQRRCRAMILAAGKGRRMGRRSETCPKPLTLIAGKSILARALEKLGQDGLTPVVVNIHHLPHMMHEALEAAVQRGDVILSDESDRLLETGGGVKKAVGHLDDDFITVNGDIIWGETPGAAATTINQLRDAWDPAVMDVLLLLVRAPEAFGYDGPGDFFYRGDDVSAEPIDFRGDAPSAPYMYGGIQIVKRSLYEAMPEGVWSNRDIFHKARSNGRLFGVPTSGYWIHVGTEDGVAKAEARLREMGD